MKQEIKDTLSAIMMSGGNGSKATVDQMLMVLDLPNEKFDEFYPQLKTQLDAIYLSPSFQKEIIEMAKINPPSQEEIETARKEIDKFIADVNEDESLSDCKKDMLKTLIKNSAEFTFEAVENPREKIQVKVIRINEDAIIPKYAHNTDAGADIYAVEETVIKPHTTVVVKTGIRVAIPVGYEIQIRPRSGMSLKTPLRVANAPGTIDSDYRGEVGVIIENTGNLTQTINKGDKIAQMVISPVPMIVWEEANVLSETERGEGGFGSTGKS